MQGFSGYISELSQEVLRRYATKAGKSKDDAWSQHDKKTILKRQKNIAKAFKAIFKTKGIE